VKKMASLILVSLFTVGLFGVETSAGGHQAKRRSHPATYVVLYRKGAPEEAVRKTLKSLGAEIVRRNESVGLATVRISDADFVARAMASGVFVGVARNRPIGRAPREVPKPGVVPRPRAVPTTLSSKAAKEGEDPLFKYQWNLRMSNAGPHDSHRIEKGDPRVLIGIMDTGISPFHLDIGRNFRRDLSRNFTTDIPVIDGRCRDERDHSCKDSAFVDPVGHGTYIAATVAGAENGFGVSSIAPRAGLVNLRVGQDSGFVFLQPTVDALTYAGDNGIDIGNMSFFIDPWLFNCPNNPADSPEAQLEQRTIIEATQRAVDYARERGVTLIGAIGNEGTDLGNPKVDPISPTFPPDSAYRRKVDNACLTMPQEAEGVINVSGLGPSGRKSWFSNYGLEQTDLSAASGDSLDDSLPYPRNMVLSAWSKAGARQFDWIDRKGRPTIPELLRRCRGPKRCSYYFFAEGTSIAAPIGTGVAALIVSAFGEEDGSGELTMAPGRVERILKDTVFPQSCPEGGVQTYPEVERYGLKPKRFRAVCEEAGGGVNGFYGHGIIDAVRALEGA
jgi:lantibiotic leader peptide-processing serine protease